MLKRNWALIAFVYLAFAEVSSLAPVPDLSLCLMQPEYSEQADDNDKPKYCPAFHTGIEVLFAAINDVFERYEKLIIGGFTVVLAISTIGLWLATNKLWVAGERQLELLGETSAVQSRDMQASIAAANRSAAAAERALTDLERPWIFVFGVNIVHIADDWIVQYTVANYGKMPAIIEAPRIGVETSPGEPPLPLLAFDDHPLTISPIMAAGEQRVLREPLALPLDDSISFRILPDGSLGEQIPTFIVPEGEDAFFMAVIRYRGPQTRGHETAALWLYQPPMEFALRGGEEFNYNH